MSRLLPLVLLLLVVACGQTGTARTARPSSCAVGSAPTWSPDGKQIAWADRQVICIENVNGSKLRHFPAATYGADALAWPLPHELLYATDYPLDRVDPANGHVEQVGNIGASDGFAFSVDKRGDLVASGCAGDPHSAQPVTVVKVATGVHTPIGGTTFNNCNPSLSPDGRYVVFERFAEDRGGEWDLAAGLWAAWSDGSHLAQLSRKGATPIWSPTGDEIAYVVPVGPAPAWSQIRLIPSGGGRSTVLVPQGVQRMTENSWSPNGKLIAFQNPEGGLSVVSLATTAVRVLRTRATVLSFAWSPDSCELLVADATYGPRCSAIWRFDLNRNNPVQVVRQPSRGRC